MKILLTGFEPFGQDAQNGSGEAVSGLGRELSAPTLPEAAALAEREDLQVVTHILPVSFQATARKLRELLAAERPDAVLCLGEAGGRTEITPETTARNLMDARIPDNDGAQPRNEVILEAAGALTHSILNAEALTAALEHAGLPASTSDDAGLFVCNSTFFHAVDWALAEQLKEPGDVKGRQPLAGFVHVPAVRSAGTASVGAETDRPESNSPEASRPAPNSPAPGEENPIAPSTQAAGGLSFTDLTRAAAVLVREAARQVAEGNPVLVQEKTSQGAFPAPGQGRS